jgi:hypothetical protein
MKCYAALEEYIKRCTSPPNTMPTSFFEISAAITGEGEKNWYSSE